MKVDDSKSLDETCGYWKAHITYFVSFQHNGMYMQFFGGAYYKQCIFGNDFSKKFLIDAITEE